MDEMKFCLCHALTKKQNSKQRKYYKFDFKGYKIPFIINDKAIEIFGIYKQNL
ncbi:hypothetical protein CSPARA_0680 [Campylobacter sputorum bv. paraureolyticus LMG 11764]|uniref:hypothetical protein n=1 Tax=Campylobacter sputorum TaxID=206 RepID=UPI001F2AB9B1|nr:hypothetical protein [Campylobacter sputorum]ASM38267.1 hypothetical protein CSPARA_0680 [Campylobacter sputorum bv. paraureolyticus LMG 11764]